MLNAANEDKIQYMELRVIYMLKKMHVMQQDLKTLTGAHNNKEIDYLNRKQNLLSVKVNVKLNRLLDLYAKL